jgi:hypothetical protein
MIDSDKVIMISLALEKIKEQIVDISRYLEVLRVNEMIMSKKEVEQLIKEEMDLKAKRALKKVIFE